VVGFFCQSLQCNAIEFFRNVFIELRRWRRIVVNNLCADVDCTSTRESRVSRNAFIQHRAQRKEIAAPVDFGTECLFWRKILWRAYYHAVARLSVQKLRSSGIVGIDRLDLFGQTKVEHLDFTTFINRDVRGLDVAMDDAVTMRLAERGGDLFNNLDCSRYG